jgi:uncharacterized protein YgbK (DUF1537 family)
LEELRDAGTAHVVVDAVADGDLQIIANACSGMPLLTGGSAVAMPLPAIYRREGLLAADALPPRRPALASRAVILSGSCSAMTNAQVAAYRSNAPSFRLDPVTLAESGVELAIDWLNGQADGAVPLIYATTQPDEVQHAQATLGAERAGQLVEDALAELALVAFGSGVRRFVVAGGETSGAVARSLGLTRLDIGTEIAPGVPWTFAVVDGEDVAVALKSGNFGTRDFFTIALARLED